MLDGPICPTGVRARTLAERVGRKHVGRAGCPGSEGCRRVGSLHVGGLWDQLERDPEQMAPVMATMLRDQLSMADRLRQTVAAESKRRAARRTLEETLQPFSRWLLAQEDPSAVWLELVADAWLFLGEFKSALQVYEQLLDLQSDAALGFWGKRSVHELGGVRS